jgi:hypothetical protein
MTISCVPTSKNLVHVVPHFRYWSWLHCHPCNHPHWLSILGTWIQLHFQWLYHWYRIKCYGHAGKSSYLFMLLNPSRLNATPCWSRNVSRCDRCNKHSTIRATWKLTFLHYDDGIFMVHGTKMSSQQCLSLGLCRAVVNWTCSLNILNREVNYILLSRIRTVYLRNL